MGIATGGQQDVDPVIHGVFQRCGPCRAAAAASSGEGSRSKCATNWLSGFQRVDHARAEPVALSGGHAGDTGSAAARRGGARSVGPAGCAAGRAVGVVLFGFRRRVRLRGRLRAGLRFGLGR